MNQPSHASFSSHGNDHGSFHGNGHGSSHGNGHGTSHRIRRPWFIRVAALAAAWVTAVIAGTVIAAVMAPWIAPEFGPQVRDPAAEGLLFPALLAGYAVITAALIWLVEATRPGSWRAAAGLGAILGVAVFVGDHLVTAGWSTLPVVPMLVSGVSDSLTIVPSAIVAWWIFNRTA